MESLEPRVVVTFMGTTIKYPYPEKNACNSLVSGECPLEKDSEATYNLQMQISKSYPTVSLNIEFALIDQNKDVEVCFNVDCEVVDQ